MTTCVMASTLPISFLASHTYIPESEALELKIVRSPSCSIALEVEIVPWYFSHLTVGGGYPSALHLGSLVMPPSLTNIGPWNIGLILGGAKTSLEELLIHYRIVYFKVFRKVISREPRIR